MICGRLYFSEVAMAIFLITHSLPEPFHCPIKIWGLFPLPVDLGPPAQIECRKNNAMWLLWLGHKELHRVRMALSQDLDSRTQLPLLWGRPSRHIVRKCRCSSQQSGSTSDSSMNNAQMNPLTTPHPYPWFISCLSWCWLEQRQAASSSPAETTDSWTT